MARDMEAVKEELIEEIKNHFPENRKEHLDYCMFRKDSSRDFSECDCEMKQYTLALRDVISILEAKYCDICNRSVKHLTDDGICGDCL